MKLVYFAAALSIAVIGVSESGLANEDALRKRFIAGMERIPVLLSDVSVRTKVNITRRYVLHDEAAARAHFSAHVKGEKPDTVVSDTQRISLHGGSVLVAGVDHRKAEYIKSENGQYAFMLTRPSSKVKFNIAALMSLSEVNRDDRMQRQVSRIKDDAISLVFTSLGGGGHVLYDLIKTPDFVLDKVSEVILDGTTYVRVDCSFSHFLRSTHQMRNAYFICDPNLNWATKEFYAEGPTETSSVRVVTTFGEQLNGFPVTKKSVATIANSAVPSFVSSTTVEVEVLSKDVDSTEFTLSHYGFPEPNFATSWFRTWMKYLLAGLACAGISYWLKRRRVTTT